MDVVVRVIVVLTVVQPIPNTRKENFNIIIVVVITVIIIITINSSINLHPILMNRQSSEQSRPVKNFHLQSCSQ